MIIVSFRKRVGHGFRRAKHTDYTVPNVSRRPARLA
jgi:hypothetical protein